MQVLSFHAHHSLTQPWMHNGACETNQAIQWSTGMAVFKLESAIWRLSNVTVTWLSHDHHPLTSALSLSVIALRCRVDVPLQITKYVVEYHFVVFESNSIASRLQAFSSHSIVTHSSIDNGVEHFGAAARSSASSTSTCTLESRSSTTPKLRERTSSEPSVISSLWGSFTVVE